MAVKFLDNTGLGYFWGKIKAWCSSTFAAIAHTHTSYAVKHSYTTATNAAKNWYRIANANTSQTDTTKPIHAQFILTAYNASYDASYYERWFVNAEVFGRTAHIVILGNTTAPFSQARVLYENTVADLDANDRPAIDIYLNYKLANGTTKIEIEEVYNSGWTFVADGQLVASTVPSGFENVACGILGNGVERSTYASYVSYLNRQISDITAAFTLADTWLYRSRTLNCTGTFTITIPSINSGYMWCVIKNKNTSSGVITLHPSTTSVLIDGSNADITLQPMEYVCIHSAGANNYSIIADGRWKSQKADKGTTLSDYGITDAKIANGTITLGSNSITPLTSVPSHNQASDTINLLTGYNKPNTGSSLVVTDTLNQALGKLEAKVDTAVANSDGIPVGSVFWLSTSTVPVGFLLCNGQAVGRDTYPDLFSAIGTTYGEGDGSTTFNLPNLIDKFIEGTNANIGISVAAGLPNIIGSVNTDGMYGSDIFINSSGAFQASLPIYKRTVTQDYVLFDAGSRLDFDASNSNNIYGNSSTVQPPALKLLPCIKAYSSVSNISELDAAQLENEVQNNFVHLTGDELIQGIKEFKNAYADISSEPDNLSSHSIVLRTTQFRKGTDFTALSKPDYINIIFQDNEGSLLDHAGRLGSIDYTAQTDGAYYIRTTCFKNDLTEPNSSTSMFVGYDINGTAFAKAPSTSVDRINGNDIVTRDWIPKDERIVHNGGTEYIAGVKRFTAGAVTVVNTNASLNVNPTDPMYWSYNFYDKNDNLSARILHYYNNDNGTRGLSLGISKKATAPDMCSIITGILTPSTNKYAVYVGNTGCTALAPYISGITLGANSTAHRWGQIYSSSTSISTSDERVKTSVESVPEEVLTVWENISWVQFQMKDAIKEKGNSARIHNGLIAQQIDAAFSEFGLDASRYGLFCYDEWNAEETIYDDIGSILTPGQEAGNLYSVRYEEALCMEAAYQRRKNKILENRISELEKRLAKLEGTI